MIAISIRVPFLATLLAVPLLRAQCTNPWLPGDGIPGVQGEVRVIHEWDPDGAGPQPALTVVAGVFWAAGTVPARNIAAWDPATQTWSALGDGVGGGFGPRVDVLLTLPNGELLAAGTFLEAGVAGATHIARWNGTSWAPLGGGLDHSVRSATVLANGDLLVVGSFQNAGGVPVSGAALWDGSGWSAFGASALSVAAAPNGEIFGIGSGPVRWTGTAWAPLGSGVTWFSASRLHVMPNSDVVVAGFALLAGQAEALLHWNGTAWSAIPSPGGVIRALDNTANGDLLAASGQTIQRWDGSTWTLFAEAPFVQTFAALPGGLIATSLQGVHAATWVMRWTGTAWTPLGGGTDAAVTKILVLPNGNRIACGFFRMIGGVEAPRIARWDGTNWSPLGTGFADDSQSPLEAVAMPNGDIVVAGPFSTVSGIPVPGLARWDGLAWSGIGSPGLAGPQPRVHSLAVTPDGHLVAGGRFTHAGGAPAANIARWDGSAWSPLGGGVEGEVARVIALPNGDIVASGNFTVAGGVPVDYVARWDGTAWSPVGVNTSYTAAHLAASDGSLIGVRTLSTQTFEVVRWDGSTWAAFGLFDYGIAAIEELPDGDLVVAGFIQHANGTPVERIARWDGATWSPIGAGVGYASVYDVAMDALRGELLVAGNFVFAGGEASSHLARVGTDCPATASPSGSGCGGDSLTAATLPWVDATLRTVGENLPAPALVFTLSSFTSVPQGAVPLAAFFGQAAPGCDVLVAPDIVHLGATGNGRATANLFLPNTPPLVGLSFHQQMVSFELDSAGTVLSITATNALELTAGSF